VAEPEHWALTGKTVVHWIGKPEEAEASVELCCRQNGRIDDFMVNFFLAGHVVLFTINIFKANQDLVLTQHEFALHLQTYG
jgi:hypothetical protein